LSLHILGMGYSHPDIVIDNKFLEDLDVGTNADWIIEKIGIKTRVTSLPLEYIKRTRNQDPRQALEAAVFTPSKMGSAAAIMAIEQAGIKAEKIGLLIANCCTPNKTAPSESQRIAHDLGINCKAYDVFSACPAFALHMDYLNNFSEDTLPEYILCISTAATTQHVNYNDRTDGAIWGDGAAAWIVSTKHPGKLKTLDTYFMADPLRCGAVVIDTFGFFRQDGRAVRDFSVRQTVRLIKRLEDAHELDWNRDIFIGHQANRTMLQQITNNREIPDSNHWHNVTELGNQAGAGAPAVMAMNWQKIKSGQKIAVAVVGAGLSWGSVLFEAS
jgi:3-oxoacyl-[acyl-carrier-protein] synthase-3